MMVDQRFANDGCSTAFPLYQNDERVIVKALGNERPGCFFLAFLEGALLFRNF